MGHKLKIAIGMSGGVDSSTAAALLKRQGHDVTGIIMQIWSGDPSMEVKISNACYGPDEVEDIQKAQEVAERIGIPLHTIDLRQEYKENVLDVFCSSYLEGQTPNPCVLCNQKIKFGFLLEKSSTQIDFDYFATGHYARIDHDTDANRYILKKGLDKKKDQSYFLYRLNQQQLKKTLFPLGTYNKKDIQNIAVDLGFEFGGESQDFISGSDYSILFSEGKKPGPIVDANGAKIGRHEGIIHYTIGQRRGLRTPAKERLYVSEIDTTANTIKLDRREKLFSSRVLVENLNWISIPELKESMSVKAKIRSTHNEANAALVPLNKTTSEVCFEEPQFAITPGQSVVFYTDDTVVGGGIIQSKS